MFRFLFPRQAKRIADLEKLNADLVLRFDELYSHLGIHRAVNYATNTSYELRKGVRTIYSSPWIDLISGTTSQPFTTSTVATRFPAPAKKRRKRK